MQVFVTRKIPLAGLKMLNNRYELLISEVDRPLEKDELLEEIKDADALLCLLHDRIDEEVISEGKDLKVISNYAVGYDNIDVNAATKRGIAVTNTPGVLTDATAELAWALMMSVARHVARGDRYVREDLFSGWDPTLMIGSELKGKTLGIIGMGSIGTAVARRSMGFGMDVIYCNRSEKPEVEKELGAVKMSLEDLLKKSDFISLHVPLADETRGMIGWKELEMMKETAYLINTARGDVVNEEALIEALRSDRIAGAALDVYADEPYGANPDLYDLDNVALTPHLGSASFKAREDMAVMAAENIIDVLEGRETENIVNPEVLRR